MDETAPTATAVLVCLGLVPGPGSSVNIIGVSGTFPETTFPSRLPRFAIFAQFSGGFGSHTIRLEIRNPTDNNALLWHDERMQCVLRDAWEIRSGYVWVNDLLIPHAGKYDVLVLCNGKKIGQQQFLVGFQIPAP